VTGHETNPHGFRTWEDRPRGRIEAVADDLLPILTKFHREVVLPDIERVLGGLRLEMSERFAGLDSHFDAIYQRFDKLETEYHMLAAGLKRVEERLSHPAACRRARQ
jgi:hypothetical protein